MARNEALDGPVPLLRGCDAAYLDLGSNRGLKIEQLLEALSLTPALSRSITAYTHAFPTPAYIPLTTHRRRGMPAGSSASFRQPTEAAARCALYIVHGMLQSALRACTVHAW